MKECEDFKGRKKAICDGSADLPLNRINKYRRSWGLDDLNSNGAVKSKNKSNTKQVKAVAGCRSCRKNKKPVITFDEAIQKHQGETSEEEAAIRQSICDGCPLLQDDMCMACGCTISKKVKNKTEQCPVAKWLPEIKERRKLNSPVKNLIMHIFPVKDLGTWQWNVKEIAKRKDLFNGRKIISIGTMDKAKKVKTRPNRVLETDSFNDVVNEFAKYDMEIDEFLHYENDDRIREVKTFIPALEKIQSSNTNEVTFSCHSKGSTYEKGSIAIEWGEVMYHTCLDDWGSTKNALELYSMAGSFRRFGQFTTPGNNKWHYSGTFYWFRHDDVFSRNWKKIDRKFFGTESWPGLMFEPQECACLFADEAADPYVKTNWRKSYRPEMEIWDEARK